MLDAPVRGDEAVAKIGILILGTWGWIELWAGLFRGFGRAFAYFGARKFSTFFVAQRPVISEDLKASTCSPQVRGVLHKSTALHVRGGYR
jgi:hypothetical protein